MWCCQSTGIMEVGEEEQHLRVQNMFLFMFWASFKDNQSIFKSFHFRSFNCWFTSNTPFTFFNLWDGGRAMDFWNLYVQNLLVWRKRKQVAKFFPDDSTILGSLFSCLLPNKFFPVTWSFLFFKKYFSSFLNFHFLKKTA